MRRLVIVTMLLFMAAVTGAAQSETPNERQARRIFNTVYERVFGPQGSSLGYDVNIVGIYKTKGKIWFKGKKQRFSDERVDVWNDGTTAYMVYRKKKTVEIHDAGSDKKDKYSGKFKFSLDDFTYRIDSDPQGLLITMKQKKSAKGTIKEVRALVSQGAYTPIRVRLKVAFIWTTIEISDFRSGHVDDGMFIFPKEKYGEGWKYVDKR